MSIVFSTASNTLLIFWVLNNFDSNLQIQQFLIFALKYENSNKINTKSIIIEKIINIIKIEINSRLLNIKQFLKITLFSKLNNWYDYHEQYNYE